MPARRSRQSQGGFSFIEVLVGIMILGIVAGAVLMGFTASSAQTARAKMDTISEKLASGKLETIRTMDYDDVGIVGGNPDGTLAPTGQTTVNGIRYDFTIAVSYVDDQTPGRARNYINYKKVVVTVTPNAPAARPITQTTLKAPPNANAVRGKATAIISVVDSLTGQPLQGVSVKLYGSTSPDRTDITGADGQVVFAGLDPSDPNVGAAKYYYYAQASASGFETDPDTTPAVIKQSLAASQTWNATIKIFKPAFIKVNVRDKATGQLVTERSQVKVSLPAPQSSSETFVGYTGAFDIPTIAGKSIQPSLSPTTVAVDADCYASSTVISPVPMGYPVNTLQVFDVNLDRIARTGRLRVWVKRNDTKAAVTTAMVQVTGGESAISMSPRKVDANGYVDFCLPKSESTLYTITAWDTKTGTDLRTLNVVTAVPEGQTVDQTMLLSKDSTCTLPIQHRLGGSQLVRLVGVNVPSPTPNVATTNLGDGRATFGNLTPGTYNVQIVGGYSGTTPVWVSAGNVPGLVNGNINCPSSVVPVVG